MNEFGLQTIIYTSIDDWCFPRRPPTTDYLSGTSIYWEL